MPVPYIGKGKGRAQLGGHQTSSAAKDGRRSKGGSKGGPSSARWKHSKTLARTSEQQQDLNEPKSVDPKCDFCPPASRTGGTLPSPMLGPYSKGRMRKEIHVHHVCAMWAPEVYHDPDTNDLVNVASAYHRSRGLTCTVCLERGATVGCYVPSCPNVYHYCCLYGTPPPSANREANGRCVRHDNYYAAFCSAHAARANDDVFMQRMRADSELTKFLSDRAAAVESALDGNPEQGRDCPGFVATGLRRNETETIFCRVWGITSAPTNSSWVTIVGRHPRRLLEPGERISIKDCPRRVPSTALAVATGEIGGIRGGRARTVVATTTPVGDRSGNETAAASPVREEAGSCKGAVDPVGGKARSGAVAARAVGAGEGSGKGAVAPSAPDPVAGAKEAQRGTGRRTGPSPPVFLLRNLQQGWAVGRQVLRQSLPAIPSSFLHATVMQQTQHRPQSLPLDTERRGGAAGGDGSGGAGGSRRVGKGATTTGPWPAPLPVTAAEDDGDGASRCQRERDL